MCGEKAVRCGDGGLLGGLGWPSDFNLEALADRRYSQVVEAMIRYRERGCSLMDRWEKMMSEFESDFGVRRSED